MERVYRTGLDVDVALATAARRMLISASANLPAVAAIGESPVAEAAISPVSPDAVRQGLRARVKRWLRRPVAIVFRLVKPFLRPIAFRTRRYLTEALHQDTLRVLAETQREVQRSSSDMLREVQSARELLRQEILTMQAQPVQEQRRLFTGLMQDQQATREMVRRLLADSVQRNAAEMARLVESQQHHAAEMARLIEAQQHHATELARLVEARRSEDAELTQTITAGYAQLADAAKASATGTASLLISTLSPRLDRLEQYGYASARRSILHCADGEVMVKTEAGYVMCSDSDLALLACLADTGDLERGTRLLIERLLQPGDVFVDVGANVGMHTMAAARALRGQGRIIAFEPFEATRQLLEKTVWINGFDAMIDIHGSAVSDREGVQTLFLGSSSGHHSLFDLGGEASASAQVSVNTVRLESVIAAGMPVNLMKIDAEGAELDVLRGALGVVRASPDIALIVEFGPAHLRRTGQTSAAWLAAFTELGFDYRAIDAVSGTLNLITLVQLEASESTNLLFARPQSAPWVRLGEAA